MTHLTKIELVDLVEHTLSLARALHLEHCDGCRAKADELREALTRSSEVDVPEPSPLFWEHLSSRVREGVQNVTPDEAPSWFGWVHQPRFKWALSGALLVLLVVVGLWRVSAPTVTHQDPHLVATTSQPEAVLQQSVAVAAMDAPDVEADEAWALVRTVADDVSWDDAMAAGLGTRPGSADIAALTLTVDERSELVRLLQAETKRPGV